MGQIGADAQRCFVEIVERGQSAGKELPVDHPFAKAFRRPEAQSQPQLVEAFAHEALIARAQRGKPVADDHPIGQSAVDETPLPAGFARHFRVMADARHCEGRGIDGAEHVEIEKTVVERRDQGVGHRMSKPHQVAVGRGRIDHHEIVAMLDGGNGFRKAREFRRLVLLDVRARGPDDVMVGRQRQLDARALRPGAPVLDVMREALLAAVEVDAGDALAGFHQGNDDVHRGGRLARASLLVTEHDHMRGTRQSHRRLQQHNATPYPESFSESNHVGVKRMYTLTDDF